MQNAVPSSFRQMRVEIFAIFGVLVAVALVYLFVVYDRQTALRASNVGLDGLQVWLTTSQLDAQRFSGGWQLEPDTIGLLVIPIYDSDLNQKRKAPTSKKELLLQQDEYDLGLQVLQKKRSRVPTMIVLPKWRSGVRLTDIAHPELMIEGKRIEKILQLLLPDKKVKSLKPTHQFTDFSYNRTDGTKLTASIYAAQLYSSEYCEPIVGSRGAMLLGECRFGTSDEDTFLLLSDPDLINNHGLRHGQNALIAKDFFASRLNGDRIIIDYSKDNWIKSVLDNTKRERTWADLMRFFEPPFLALWFATAFLFALFVWRGAIRFGPAETVMFEDGSKQSTMISAFSKIMRVSNQDGAMASEYATARISAVVSALFDPAQARMMAQEDNFVDYVKKRDTKLADRLKAALDNIHGLPAQVSPEAAMQHIDELEQVLENITHGS